MNIEQGCQPLRRVVKCDGRKSAGRVLSVHILLNDPGSYYVGPIPKTNSGLRICARMYVWRADQRGDVRKSVFERTVPN